MQSDYTIVIYKALCFDVAQGRMNEAPNETRTHSSSLLTATPPEVPHSDYTISNIENQM